MKCFDINEKLKEELVLNCNSFFTKTVWLSAGVGIINEPFYETTACWNKGEDLNDVERALKIIKKYQKQINKTEAEMVDPLFEYNLGHPTLIWAIFPEELK